nr:MAG TPA: hypothetical protein [Caudoviricetes sp.]
MVGIKNAPAAKCCHILRRVPSEVKSHHKEAF